KDPDTRLDIAEAAQMLRRIVDDASYGATAPTALVPAALVPDGGRPRRHSDYRALIAALALIVAAAAGITAFALLAGRSSGHPVRPGAAPRPSASTRAT